MEVAVSRGLDKAVRLSGEWGERTDAVMQQVAYSAAVFVRDLVLKHAPKDLADRYRSNLKIAWISGLSDEFGFLLYVDSMTRRIERDDASKVALYILPKSGFREPPPEVSVLSEYGPWTYKMLPFMPSRRDADVVSRRLRETEIAQIERHLRATERKWTAELAKAGAAPKKQKKDRLLGGMDTTPDLAFEALRAEFGLDSQGRPHWRLALKRLKSELPSIVKQRHFLRTMIDPNYKGWERSNWEGLGAVSASEVQSRFLPFMKALRI